MHTGADIHLGEYQEESLLLDINAMYNDDQDTLMKLVEEKRVMVTKLGHVRPSWGFMFNTMAGFHTGTVILSQAYDDPRSKKEFEKIVKERGLEEEAVSPLVLL